MKKELLIVLCLFATIIMGNSYQQIDQAIRESDLEKVEQILGEKSLTSKEAIVLYVLAQEVSQRYHEACSDDRIIITNKYDFAYICGALFGSLFSVMGMIITAAVIGDKINNNEDITPCITPMLVSICMGLIARKSIQKVHETQVKVANDFNKLYNDALTIKGLILNQVDLVNIRI